MPIGQRAIEWIKPMLVMLAIPVEAKACLLQHMTSQGRVMSMAERTYPSVQSAFIL